MGTFDKKLTNEEREEINKSISHIAGICTRYEDCTDDCPLCEISNAYIPHCKVSTSPNNWELLKNN